MNGIGLKELAFVGYAVNSMQDSRKFYRDILGLKETSAIEHEGAIHWVEYDLAGQTLALAQASEQWQPSAHGGGACLEVEDLDRAVEYLKAQQVQISMDIQNFPFCRIALIADPSGNTLALHQRNANHPEHSGSHV